MKRVPGISAAVFITMMICSVAYAQEYTCIIINGVKCIIRYDGCGAPSDTLCSAGSTGKGVFVSLSGPIPPVGPINVQLRPQTDGVEATVNHPALGTITTKSDGRNHPPSTFKTVNGAVRFPVVGIIRFYATATLSSDPCRLYISKAPIELGSNVITSINPFRNESFLLLTRAEFYLEGDSFQRTVFALQPGTTGVTLGTDDGDLQ